MHCGAGCISRLPSAGGLRIVGTVLVSMGQIRDLGVGCAPFSQRFLQHEV
jgi:hypothetical protein